MAVCATPRPSGSRRRDMDPMVVSDTRVVPSCSRCLTRASTASLTRATVRCRLRSYTAASSQGGADCFRTLPFDIKVHLWFSSFIFAAYLNHVHFFELTSALLKLFLVLDHFQGQPFFACSLDLD